MGAGVTRYELQEFNPNWRGWVMHQPESATCLFCTRPATDWCHIEHGSFRRGDYLGFPACHEHHMMLDHTPRGPGHARLLKESHVKIEIAYWCTCELPVLIHRYREDRDADTVA